MNTAVQEQYRRIATAIRFIISEHSRQPSLEEIAAVAHYSPFHFQKIFSEMTGVSPKKFQQMVKMNYLKSLLPKEKKLADLSEASGLSGTSRLHDLFITLEAMSPAAYRNGGAALTITHSYHETPFGKMLVASTDIGICHMAFCENELNAFQALQARFPAAKHIEANLSVHEAAVRPIRAATAKKEPIHLHLKGTPFQLKVWQALLKIPEGHLASYAHIAEAAGDLKASRAAGSAIGANPIAFLIPCHRVIRGSGLLGGYRWGLPCKEALLARELGLIPPNQSSTTSPS